MIQGTLVLIVCMIAGFRPQSLAAIPLALLFMALIAIVFAALGTAIGSSLKDMQGFQLIMNFHGDADLLPVRRAVSAVEPADGVDDRHAARSDDLRCGRPARGVHRRARRSASPPTR